MSRGGQRPLVSPLLSPIPLDTDVSSTYQQFSPYGPGPGSQQKSVIGQMPPPRNQTGGFNNSLSTRPAYGAQVNARPPTGSGRRSPSNNDRRMSAEASARIHWEAFRHFLSHGVEAAHPRQNKAREKLTRLSRTQFQELSTDVYDEVQRRTNPLSQSAALTPNSAFHPKRNQAREKLASLQTPRFKDLASDVFFEIERRFPGIRAQLNGMEAQQMQRRPSALSDVSKSSTASGRPPQSSNVYRQTAVVPNKSLMIEDGDSDYDEKELKSPRYDLDSLSIDSNDLTARSRTASSSQQNSIFKTNGNDRMPSDGEQERLINELRSRIRDLELSRKNDTDAREVQQTTEMYRSKSEHLEKELAELKRSHQRAAEFESENERLQKEIQEQQLLTEEVRAEAEGFLNEMRGLSDKESRAFEHTEALERKIQNLEAEVQRWKQKFQDTKIQLRQLKTTSQFFSPMPNIGDHEHNAYLDPNGIIRDSIIAGFQVAIDDLLRQARNNSPKLLDIMKDIILTTRAIQKDLDNSSSSIAQDSRVAKLKQRMSNTTNNLTTACKNHISGGTLAPVSLVDAAASHLTSTVIELAKLCKLKEATDAHDSGTNARASNRSRSSSGSSAASDARFPFTPLELGDTSKQFLTDSPDARVMSSKRQGSMYTKQTMLSKALALENPTDDTSGARDEIQEFLELHTSAIVNSIQQLLSSIRLDARPAILQQHMNDITLVVTKVTKSMHNIFQSSMTLRVHAKHIVTALEQCTERMAGMEASVLSKQTGERATKDFKQELAGLAFETAKQTKELSIALQSEAGESDGESGSPVDLT